MGPDQPLFAHAAVLHVGQALGLVVARSARAARAGAARVRVSYSPAPPLGADDSAEPGAALTTLEAAEEAGSFYDLSRFPSAAASKGDVAAALAAADRVLSGTVHLGGQRHAYMVGAQPRPRAPRLRTRPPASRAANTPCAAPRARRCLPAARTGAADRDRDTRGGRPAARRQQLPGRRHCERTRAAPCWAPAAHCWRRAAPPVLTARRRRRAPAARLQTRPGAHRRRARAGHAPQPAARQHGRHRRRLWRQGAHQRVVRGGGGARGAQVSAPGAAARGCAGRRVQGWRAGQARPHAAARAPTCLPFRARRRVLAAGAPGRGHRDGRRHGGGALPHAPRLDRGRGRRGAADRAQAGRAADGARGMGAAHAPAQHST